RRAFAIACVPAALSAQAKFEGTITAKMSAAAGSADVTYFVKGDQFRMDMAGRAGSMYILRDQAKNTTYMAMPTQRMYMEMPGASTAEAAAEAKPRDVKMTGRKETVAGIECEHATITSDNIQYDACIAHGLGMFPMVNNPMGRGRGAEAPAA